MLIYDIIYKSLNNINLTESTEHDFSPVGYLHIATPFDSRDKPEHSKTVTDQIYKRPNENQVDFNDRVTKRMLGVRYNGIMHDPLFNEHLDPNYSGLDGLPHEDNFHEGSFRDVDNKHFTTLMQHLAQYGHIRHNLVKEGLSQIADKYLPPSVVTVHSKNSNEEGIHFSDEDDSDAVYDRMKPSSAKRLSHYVIPLYHSQRSPYTVADEDISNDIKTALTTNEKDKLDDLVYHHDPIVSEAVIYNPNKNNSHITALLSHPSEHIRNTAATLLDKYITPEHRKLLPNNG